LTLALAYLSYFVADFTAGTSGVLAVVTAGTMVAYLGRPSIVGEENNALEVFWEMVRPRIRGGTEEPRLESPRLAPRLMPRARS